MLIAAALFGLLLWNGRRGALPIGSIRFEGVLLISAGSRSSEHVPTPSWSLWAAGELVRRDWRLLVRFPVTAALRYPFALARRFRFEGFGIRAAIHANPDLLSAVRALVIVCAVHAPNCTLGPRPRGEQFSFSLISFGLRPAVQHSSCGTQKRRRELSLTSSGSTARTLSIGVPSR
jgi:hypothetical protein